MGPERSTILIEPDLQYDNIIRQIRSQNYDNQLRVLCIVYMYNVSDLIIIIIANVYGGIKVFAFMMGK